MIEKMMVTPLMAACVVAMLEKKNMGKRCRGKKVIRIHDDGPFEICNIELRYFLEEAVWDDEQKVWSMRWVRENGQPISFSRRCDASRWAGKHYPGWERQHWRTL